MHVCWLDPCHESAFESRMVNEKQVLEGEEISCDVTPINYPNYAE